jgi:hypothetical protein
VADRTGKRDEATLHVLAILDGTTVAEQRRQAVRSYCARARQDDDVAEIVRLILAARRERSGGGGNVIEIGGRRG